MEQGKLSQSELPNEIEGVELPESFELTLDSYIMDADSWIDYLAGIIVKSLKGKDAEVVQRFMDSIEAYIILNQIENNPGIDSETVTAKTENLYIALSRYIIHYLYGFNKI